MNTFLKSLVAIFAIALPAALTAETYGVSLPNAVNTSHMFGAFVVALTVLTMWNDYAPAKRLSLSAAAKVSAPAKASARLPLAA